MLWARRRARRALGVLASTPLREIDTPTLAERVGLSTTQVQAVLMRLRREGLVVSQPDPDGRQLHRATRYGLWIAGGGGRRPRWPWTSWRADEETP
ncbi:hypothetical protein ACQPW3_27170 [Actinosynnema sp. CA-248983]